jgi:oligopeptide/dipeptide ABC transporter ATP-binding protein
MKEPKQLLRIENLKKYFKLGVLNFTQRRMKIKAVDGISISIERGQTFGLVGESGCGKSTLGRTILRLIEPTDGNIFFEDENITNISSKQLKAKRKKMQIIFQDPYASLNPRMTVYQILLEPFRVHYAGKKSNFNKRIEHLLDIVGLSKKMLTRYPHEFSGGQRQRIGIARALALNPDFIIADEPVSSLDVSVQAQILNLLKTLQKELDLTYLFISHNLAVIQHISDEIGVMYLGKLVEKTTVEQLFSNPGHPYTRILFSAIPTFNFDKGYLIKNLPEKTQKSNEGIIGCNFWNRCPNAKKICYEKAPEMKNIGTYPGEHQIRCHFD